MLHGWGGHLPTVKGDRLKGQRPGGKRRALANQLLYATLVGGLGMGAFGMFLSFGEALEETLVRCR